MQPLDSAMLLQGVIAFTTAAAGVKYGMNGIYKRLDQIQLVLDKLEQKVYHDAERLATLEAVVEIERRARE